MKIIRSPESMSDLALRAVRNGKSIGFVPTMGALHEGHASLIRQARIDNDLVVVSIFVNPTQFGPKEDLKKYPRKLAVDAKLCRKEKVDIIFYPEAAKIYPEGYRTYVNVEGLSEGLCGKSRPGHFRGVATVVAKLFNIVRPDRAYFGQKDAQQAIVIRRMCEDLNFPVCIRLMPTVREAGGLAMSSRNAYLSCREKKDALVLARSLSLAEYLVKNGLTDTDRLIRLMRNIIERKETVKIDYVAVVDAQTLKPLKKISGDCLIAVAAWIGKTRLIDNILIKMSPRHHVTTSPRLTG